MNTNLNILTIPLEKYLSLDKKETIIVIPCGCIENHGYHLPLGTDCLLAQSFAYKINESFPSILTPVISYGSDSVPNCGGGFFMPGTLSVSGKEFTTHIYTLIKRYMKDGFKKFIVLNGHLENKMFIHNAIFDIYKEGIDDFTNVMMIDYWDLIDNEVNDIVFGKDEVNYDAEHGGVLETSLMLYLYEDLVNDHKNKSDKVIPTDKFTIINNHIINKTIEKKEAILSDPKSATKKKGFLMFEHINKRIKEIIENNFN